MLNVSEHLLIRQSHHHHHHLLLLAAVVVVQSALSSEHDGQQSHANVHAIFGLTEIRCALVGVKLRAVTHSHDYLVILRQLKKVKVADTRLPSTGFRS